MTCNFRVGQKVVCVEDAWVYEPSPLTKGRIYTVIGFTDPIWSMHGVTGVIYERELVLLVEVTNPYPLVIGFAPDRFRPIVERKTDISIFKAMLTGKKQEERV